MAAHGTRSGYNQHLREGTPPCPACWTANADVAQARRDRLRQQGQAEPGFQGDPRFQPPKLQAPLRPMQERAAEESAAAEAVHGQSESAQSRRDRHKAAALAAELLDLEDQLRPAATQTPLVVDTPWWVSVARLWAQPARAPTVAIRPVAPGSLAMRGPAAAGAPAPSAADLFAEERELVLTVSRGGRIDLERHGALAMMAHQAALDPCIRQAVGGPVADRALAVIDRAKHDRMEAAKRAAI